MDSIQKGVMTTNYAYLVDHVDALAVHPKLVPKQLVNPDFHQRLVAEKTRKEQVKILLQEIDRSPDSKCFDKFTAALAEVDPPHKTIADKLVKDYADAVKANRRHPPPAVQPAIADRARTEPPPSTGNTVHQPPLSSPSAPGTSGPGAAGRHAAQPPAHQEAAGQPQPETAQGSSPPPPPKKAPENRPTECPPDENITDVSFAILVANENEYLTVLNYFGMGFKIVSENQKYTDDVLRCTFDMDLVIAPKGSEAQKPALSQLGDYYSIVINGKKGIIYKSVAIGSGGRYGAMMTTIALLKEAKNRGWHLQIIFAVGCAGGRARPEEVLTLGQVIVPKYVVEFNRGKVERGDDGQPKFIRDPEWWLTSRSWFGSLRDSVIHRSGEKGIGLQVSEAYGYCSDLVVKDPGVAERLRETIGDPKMIGIEMEGVGMATAIEIMRTLDFYHIIKEVPEFVVVKGLSDNANGSAKGAPAPMTFFETRYEDVYPDDRQVMATLQSVTLVARAMHKHSVWKARPDMQSSPTPEDSSWCQIL